MSFTAFVHIICLFIWLIIILNSAVISVKIKIWPKESTFKFTPQLKRGKYIYVIKKFLGSELICLI